MNKILFLTFTLLFLSTSSYAKKKSSDQNLFHIISSQANFSSFTKAIEESGMKEIIESAEELTIFVPDDAAFAKLSDSAMEQLFSNKDLLRYIVEFHLSEEIILTEDFDYRYHNNMMNGRATSVMMEEGKILIDQSQIIKGDIRADNGIIHVIERVIGSM